MQEIENILAAQSNFRKAAMICTQITDAKVSSATFDQAVGCRRSLGWGYV